MRITLSILISTLALSIAGCKKEKQYDVYARKMNGTHKWHGAYDRSYGTIIEHRIISDTTVEIKVYEGYILFGTFSMPFESLNTSNKTVRYSVNDASNLSFYSVTYYYDADSITYRYSETLGHTGKEYLDLKTP